MNSSLVVVPGQRLGSVESLSSGVGTFIRAGKIYSSLIGIKHVLSTDTKVLLAYTSGCRGSEGGRGGGGLGGGGCFYFK